MGTKEVSTMRNRIYRNHTTLQLKLKNNSYTTIIQLSFGYYNYYATILLEIQVLINKFPCQKIS
jgi:hypothetical protein